MRCVRFVARGVLVLSLVLALGTPTAQARRRWEEPPTKNPIAKIFKTLVLKICGDGLTVPWP